MKTGGMALTLLGYHRPAESFGSTLFLNFFIDITRCIKRSQACENLKAT
jgi:hypothetical protein